MVDLQTMELDNVLVCDPLNVGYLVADCLQRSCVLLLHRHLFHRHHLPRIQVETLVHLAKPTFP